MGGIKLGGRMNVNIILNLMTVCCILVTLVVRGFTSKELENKEFIEELHVC